MLKKILLGIALCVTSMCALVLVGCGNDYESDIAALNRKINDLQQQINSLTVAPVTTLDDYVEAMGKNLDLSGITKDYSLQDEDFPELTGGITFRCELSSEAGNINIIELALFKVSDDFLENNLFKGNATSLWGEIGCVYVNGSFALISNQYPQYDIRILSAFYSVPV